ncbi:MAG TPA: polyphosphate kinase 2 family protein [Candidatus Eisenbacteria bacterium]|nr:polyphosphate kinase 2 family protein [Candidatus Eisenbacteria bacterium]
MKIGKLAHKFCVDDGKHFRLKDYDPAETGHWKSKEHAAETLQERVARTADLQDKLYAQDEWALLLIFQAMDAAGKDGAIAHVMTGVNPQGCEVTSFKTPSARELQHDFLWRTTRQLPERGHIGIFNRSYYEEVLVVRVHSEALKNEKIPSPLMTKKIWDERFEDICCFERHMARSGTIIRKFFLHLSHKEQKKRFLARLDEPEKNWKFSASDVHERKYWDDYQNAYEDMIRNTSTKHAPWYVVPADNKWFTRLVISTVIVDTLESLKLQFPKVDGVKRKELEAAKQGLLKEK